MQSSSLIETMITNVRAVTELLEESNTVIKDAYQLSMQGKAGAKNANEAAMEIAKRSGDLLEAGEVIQNVASQTNLLAMNAAIEAAHAGESGKGFAVVADEVGNLAQKSAKAAQNTSSLIEETIDAVNKGARISGETADSLKNVSDRTATINQIINDINSASESEAEGITQISIGMNQISSVVQTNSATAEESAAASEELSGQAQILNDLVSKFTLKK